MSKPNLLIILAQSLEQPRIVKRIIEKSFQFENIQVYGFKRTIHAVNNYGVLEDYPNVDVELVGTFSDNNYLSRVRGYARLLSIIHRNHGFKKKHLYVFGLDLRIISFLLFNSKIEYEISDIMWLYKPKLKRVFLKNIDAFLVSRSNRVIFTSKGFYDIYYKRYKNENQIVIKENKFKTYGKVQPIENIKSDTLRIAYIGAFRYTDIIENLIKVVGQKKDAVLNFYGDGSFYIVQIIKKNAMLHQNIHYHGAFKNPDDLQKIYSENNINFVVYDNRLDNEKVAMPNKFYESGYFNIPIVCADNTYVGKRVLELDMGWTTGITTKELSTFFNNLSITEIIKCHKNITKLNKELFQS
ncbi:glycosyltransferase family protein [Arenibacter lacus]|uniref:glycosyltransferase family 4 protein n=1 Tax=Arenibacter lacus TaxID=2608629 RepID=UPI00123DFECE|nr:glycosyltransferase family 4 protein [Arenibacter lacus]